MKAEMMWLCHIRQAGMRFGRGPLAQLAEQLPLKQLVPSSSLGRPTKARTSTNVGVFAL